MPGVYGFSEGDNQMGKGLILWLLGVPGIIVILLLLTHVI